MSRISRSLSLSIILVSGLYCVARAGTSSLSLLSSSSFDWLEKSSQSLSLSLSLSIRVFSCSPSNLLSLSDALSLSLLLSLPFSLSFGLLYSPDIDPQSVLVSYSLHSLSEPFFRTVLRSDLAFLKQICCTGTVLRLLNLSCIFDFAF